MNEDSLISSAINPPDSERAYKYAMHALTRSATDIAAEFDVSDDLKPVLRGLALYFSGDSRFEEEGYGSLKKGLFVTGNVGTGKTLLMRAASRAFAIGNKRMLEANTSAIVDKYVTQGIESIARYMCWDASTVDYRAEAGIYFFDDLGAEPKEAKFMGNSLNVMQRVIMSRYDLRIPFTYTHFTSNVGGEEIETMYGTRVRSRLREMVNFIEVPGYDKRK